MPSAPAGVRPLTLALVGLFAFDVYLFSEMLLFSRIHPVIWSVRGLPTRSPCRWSPFRPRAIRVDDPCVGVAQRGLSLHRPGGVGLFLLLIAGAGYYMRYFGGEWGRRSSWRCCSVGALFLG